MRPRKRPQRKANEQLELFPPDPPKPRRAKQNVRVGPGQIRVTAQRRQEPDVDKIVAALLRIIEQDSRDNKEDQRKRAA